MNGDVPALNVCDVVDELQHGNLAPSHSWLRPVQGAMCIALGRYEFETGRVVAKAGNLEAATTGVVENGARGSIAVAKSR